MSKRKESIPVMKRQRFKNVMDGNKKKTRKKKGELLQNIKK
jgi:hypothetical protein